MNKIFYSLLAVLLLQLSMNNAVYAGIPVHDSYVKEKQKNKRKKRRFDKCEDTPEEKKPNRNSTLAFAFGLGSLVLPLLAIPALVLGITALAKKEPNEGFALTGVIIGGLYTLLFIILIIAFIFLI